MKLCQVPPHLTLKLWRSRGNLAIWFGKGYFGGFIVYFKTIYVYISCSIVDFDMEEASSRRSTTDLLFVPVYTIRNEPKYNGTQTAPALNIHSTIDTGRPNFIASFTWSLRGKLQKRTIDGNWLIYNPIKKLSTFLIHFGDGICSLCALLFIITSPSFWNCNFLLNSFFFLASLYLSLLFLFLQL